MSVTDEIRGGERPAAPPAEAGTRPTVADVVRAVTDGEPPVRITGVRRQRGRPGRRRRHPARSRPSAGCPTCSPRPATWAWPGRTSAGDLELRRRAPGRPVRGAAGARGRACGCACRRRPRRWRWSAGSAGSGCSRRRRRRRRRPRLAARGARAAPLARPGRAAVQHHYDVSNAFYEKVLGPSMTYTCAVYRTRTTPWSRPRRRSTTWSPASSALKPGMRLLDVGLRLGRHGPPRRARVRRQGARRHAVAASRPQWAQAAIEREGLTELAEVRHMDYRDAPAEHVRRGQLDRADRAHRRAQLPDVLRRAARPAAARRPAAQPLHHPRRQPGADQLRRVHRPVRLPGRRAGRPRPR